jgi:hypothetical protein
MWEGGAAGCVHTPYGVIYRMKRIVLTGGQVITLNDYPLHSPRVLRQYLDKCTAGEDLPLVPVIHKDVVRPHFKGELAAIFREFEELNPAAMYFMLDGSHRTTALMLAGRQIHAVVYEMDGDIVEAKAAVKEGLILENATLDYTVEENCEILVRHFTERPYFMTVQQKTDRMVKERIIE